MTAASSHGFRLIVACCVPTATTAELGPSIRRGGPNAGADGSRRIRSRPRLGPQDAGRQCSPVGFALCGRPWLRRQRHFGHRDRRFIHFRVAGACAVLRLRDRFCISAVGCGSTCPNGAMAGTYVSIAAQATYNTNLNYQVVPSTYTLTAQSNELQWSPGRWRDQRGATALEFALLAPVFVLLIFGIIGIGMLFWTQVGLQHGVQMAARCASVTRALSQRRSNRHHSLRDATGAGLEFASFHFRLQCAGLRQSGERKLYVPVPRPS